METWLTRYKYFFADRNWYIRAIGSLMYAILGICLYIIYFIFFSNKLFRNPDSQYIHAIKPIIQYLCKTIKLELAFCGDFKLLVEYINLDWIRAPETHYSTSDYLFNIDSRVISWFLKR